MKKRKYFKKIFILIIFIFIFNKLKANSIIKKKGDKFHSQAIYVYNISDNKEVFELNAEHKLYPASLTKIMTSILSIEHIEDLNSQVQIDYDSYKDMIAKNSSMAGFYANETVTFNDLLYGTILESGGETSNTLAISVSGDINNFVELMNEKANSLNLKNTNFTSPEGLHNVNQYSTAKDMAKLLLYSLNNSTFKKIFTSDTYNTSKTLDHPEGILLRSNVKDKLCSYDYNNFKILGAKSGTTYEAGQCLISLGVKNKKEYLVVVMNSPLGSLESPYNKHIEDTLKIYSEI